MSRVLGPTVIVKLAFVHAQIHAQAGRTPKPRADSTLRAVVAGFKRRVGAPEPN